MTPDMPRLLALLLAIGCVSRSPAVADQGPERATTAENLTIAVTVEPVCTVTVNTGKSSADDAVDVGCRNLRSGQPEPLVIEADETTPGTDFGDAVIIRF
jgi:hypothetical protein